MQPKVDRSHLTSGEAARRLCISRYTLLRAVKRGEVVPVLRTPGGNVCFLPAAIDAYARQLAPSPICGMVVQDGSAAGVASGRGALDAREEFVSSAAYDLKNALTSILGHAQLAQRRLARLTEPEAVPLAQYLASVIAAGERMARMLEELADLTRLRMGAKLELGRHPSDLVALVRGMLAQHAGLTEFRLTVESVLPRLEVLVDPARMERAIGNLLSNALTYSPHGEDVTVGRAMARGAQST
jgi:signal transduction histidine kinase